MLSVAFLIGVVSLFPAYFRALTEEQSAQSALASLSSDKNKNGLTEIEKNVSKDQALLGFLSDGLDQPKVSLLIQKIASVRGEIQLSQFLVSEVASSSVSFTIQGFAPTRDSLQAFQKRLEASSGNKVELPVSELAKSADIDFSLQVKEQLP